MECAKRRTVRAVATGLFAALVFSVAFGQTPPPLPSATIPAQFLSELYRFSKDFQTLFGALFGLFGVAATLYFNARKERVAQETAERNDSRALAIALSEELRILKRFLDEQIGLLHRDFTRQCQEFRFYVSRVNDLIYKANLERIGILPAASIQPVVSAYLAYGELLPQLYGLSEGSEEIAISIARFETVEQVTLSMGAKTSDISPTVDAVLPVFENLQKSVKNAVDVLRDHAS